MSAGFWRVIVDTRKGREVFVPMNTATGEARPARKARYRAELDVVRLNNANCIRTRVPALLARTLDLGNVAKVERYIPRYVARETSGVIVMLLPLGGAHILLQDVLTFASLSSLPAHARAAQSYAARLSAVIAEKEAAR